MKHQLSVGDDAPYVAATAVDGSLVTTGSMQRRTLFVFLRYSACPWCNLAIHRLSLEYPILQKNGCDVVAFVQSDPEKIQKNILDRHKLLPPFPIIADPDQKYYSLYGVAPQIGIAAYAIKNMPQWLEAVNDYDYSQKAIDGNLFIVPAFFLLDRNGKVEMVDYSASFYDHSTFTPIYELLTFDA